MKNLQDDNIKPKDLVEIAGIPFYVVAELKTERFDFVELSNLADSSIMFAAKEGDMIIPISDEKLISSLARDMASQAKDNSRLLLEAVENAKRYLFPNKNQ